jgi:hypothetical protein
MLGKLITALRPGPFDHLDEATLNAAIALIAAVNPRTEHQALLAVQIVATGFTQLKFLSLSQRHLDETYIPTADLSTSLRFEKNGQRC